MFEYLHREEVFSKVGFSGESSYFPMSVASTRLPVNGCEVLVVKCYDPEKGESELMVQGRVFQWHSGKNEADIFKSKIIPIVEQEEQKRIRLAIDEAKKIDNDKKLEGRVRFVSEE